MLLSSRDDYQLLELLSIALDKDNELIQCDLIIKL